MPINKFFASKSLTSVVAGVGRAIGAKMGAGGLDFTVFVGDDGRGSADSRLIFSEAAAQCLRGRDERSLSLSWLDVGEGKGLEAESTESWLDLATDAVQCVLQGRQSVNPLRASPAIVFTYRHDRTNR